MSTLLDALRFSWDELRARPLKPVRVAVVDSGVDARHPDLRARVVEAWRVETRGGVRAVPAARGRNQDLFGHGTGVAGIVTRIAPNAEIVDVRVLDRRNEAGGEMLVAGFERALKTGSRIVNLSLACSDRFAGDLQDLCERAYRHNQVVVAAKRNMPLFDLGYPAEFSTCISVDLGRFPTCFQLHWRKPPIEVVAQGEQVMTTAAGGGYAPMTGTSFATPTVSGLCALLLGAFPSLQMFELKALLKWFAQSDPPAGPGGRGTPRAAPARPPRGRRRRAEEPRPM
jgi:subtilisin family serine protease